MNTSPVVNDMKMPLASANKTRIPRPINSFMAFRLEKYSETVSHTRGLNHRDISKIVAKLWREATEGEKAPYHAIAAKSKIDHAKRFPGYNYQPVKRNRLRTRRISHESVIQPTA